MQGLEELADFNPVLKGEVYRNSKTKIFTDGTTNTICSRTNQQAKNEEQPQLNQHTFFIKSLTFTQF